MGIGPRSNNGIPDKVVDDAMQPNDPVVAIVDDDASIRRALGRLLRALNFQSREYGSGDDFLANLDHDRPACILLDLHMPQHDGLQVLLRMKSTGEGLPVVIITGFDQPGMREKCLQAGAAGYLLKPLDGHSVDVAIHQAITAAS